MKYYDSSLNQLIYIREEATPDYWDNHWDTENIRQKILNSGRRSYVARVTKKYLNPNDGPILEGGCGLGGNVESLRLNGYKCIGLDNARRTVQILRDNIPELDIRFGDVRRLDFPSDYFAGYWSIGVIEHFCNGYDDIANEMLKVIKPGGYLFLSFPFMSYCRRIKAKLGFYEEFNNRDAAGFYQFALNVRNVSRDFEKMGFKLIKKKPRSILYGVKDESPSLGPIVDFLAKHRDKNILNFLLYSVISMMFGHIFAHMILLVFRKAN
jgi:SAM-dependent methyltransferase